MIQAGPLRAPQPLQLLANDQALLDWLEPNGPAMRLWDASQVRRAAAERLAARIGNLRRAQAAEEWISAWATAPTNPARGLRDARLVALQLEAHQVFGGEISHLAADARRADVASVRRAEGRFLQDLLLAMYQESQEEFQKRNIEQVTLWRGEKEIFNLSQLAPLEISALASLQPLNSFTHNVGQAVRFADSQEGAVIIVSAPAARILATPATGLGVLLQREEVVLSLSAGASGEVVGQSSDQGFVAQWDTSEVGRRILSFDLRDWVDFLQQYFDEEEAQ